MDKPKECIARDFYLFRSSIKDIDMAKCREYTHAVQERVRIVKISRTVAEAVADLPAVGGTNVLSCRMVVVVFINPIHSKAPTSCEYMDVVQESLKLDRAVRRRSWTLRKRPLQTCQPMAAQTSSAAQRASCWQTTSNRWRKAPPEWFNKNSIIHMCEVTETRAGDFPEHPPEVATVEHP